MNPVGSPTPTVSIPLFVNEERSLNQVKHRKCLMLLRELRNLLQNVSFLLIKSSRLFDLKEISGFLYGRFSCLFKLHRSRKKRPISDVVIDLTQPQSPLVEDHSNSPHVGQSYHHPAQKRPRLDAVIHLDDEPICPPLRQKKKSDNSVNLFKMLEIFSQNRFVGDIF